MKHFRNHFLTIACLLLGLVSCKDDNRGYPEIGPNGEILTKGIVSFVSFDVQVEADAKAADGVSTDDYVVTLTNVKTGAVTGEWRKADVPATLEVYSGDYTLTATNLKSPKSGIFEQPHYHGSQSVTVSEKQTSKVAPLTCKQKNMRVTISCDATFRSEMQSYFVRVYNNKGNVLVYPADEARAGYFQVAPLTAQLSGTLLDGSKVEKYLQVTTVAEGDRHNFHFVGTYAPGGFDISVDLTTNDKSVDVILTDDNPEVVIPEPDPDPDPDPNPDPDPEPGNAPSIAGVDFDISKTMFLAKGEARNVDVNVKAPDGGIKSLTVGIESPTLMPLLEMIGLSASLNLSNPSTTKPDPDKPSEKEALQTLSLISDEPIVGKTDFTFSIGTFMPMLPEGNHKFTVNLQDNAGKTIKATLAISVSSK